MKRSPLKRKTELRRKRPKPRRVRAACTVRGCARPPKAASMCLTHCKRECDRLFSLAVRARGYCERCGSTERLQCSHIVSRRYLAVRWLRMNAEALCAKCHHFQHSWPLEAEAEVIGRIGQEDFDYLKRTALAGKGSPDYETILAELRRDM